MGVLGKKESARQRTAAEWISFSVSLLVVLFLSGYLLTLIFDKERVYFPVTVEALPKEVVKKEGRFILPVRVVILKGRAFSKLEVEVKSTSKVKGEAKTTLSFEYLAPQTEQRAYLYFDEDPVGLQVEVKPIFYTLE